MRIIRPQQLVILKSGYQVGKECHMGISVVAGCYLSHPTQFVTEPQIWEHWKTAPLSFPVLDAAEPKPFAEYLLAGHAGIGERVRSLDVRVRLGSLTRQWRVEGESGKAAVRVAPFIRMPMDHTHTWGGKGCKENPLGRGYNDSRSPTVMSIGSDGSAVVRSPLAAPTPLPHDFQLRKAHLDRLAGMITDKQYLESFFPGFPPALDYRYFQMAAPAQWLSTPEWPDHIPFELEGFHPVPLSGTLPSVRARAFAWYKAGGENAQEIPLQRKTLWLLPNSNMALLIFTGSIPLTHLFEEPVATLLLALDRVENPRDPQHFQQVYTRRITAGSHSFEFLFDPDLMPEAMSLNVTRDLSSHPYSLRYDATPPPAEQAVQFYQQVRQAIEQQAESAIQEKTDWHDLPVDPLQQAQSQQWLAQGAAKAENLVFSHLDFSSLTLTGKQFQHCRFQNCNFSQAQFTDCQFVNCQFEEGTWQQARFIQVQLVGCTLTKTRLQETHFTQCQWQKCTMESLLARHCLFSHNQWENCVANQGEFSHTRFEHCELNSSFFSDTGMSAMQQLHGKLTSCLFNNCQAEQSRFVDTVLEKSSLVAGNWSDTQFEHCQLICFTTGMGIDFSAVHLDQCWLHKVGFNQANLQHSTLSHCAISEGSYDGANLNAAQITACDMAGVRFKDASMTHASWYQTSLQQSLFYNADLRDTRFRHCNLASANMAMTQQNSNTLFDHCLLEKTHWIPRHKTLFTAHSPSARSPG